MNQYDIPGLSIGVVKGDSLIYTKGYGVQSIKHQKPVTESTMFHTASVSKIFTALAIMNLVKYGQLALADTLTKVLPTLRYRDKRVQAITIKTLLNHTSGIPDVGAYHWSGNHQSDRRLQEYVMGKKIKLKFAPSYGYKYSNLGYNVLGYVIERVAGLSFEEYVKTSVLLPGGMKESDFRYFTIPDSLKALPHSKHGITKNIYPRNTYPYTREHAPSSTLNASAKELSTWMISFMEALEAEQAPYLLHTMLEQSTNMSKFIGLGFQLYSIEGKKGVGHFGGDKGFRSYLLMLPDEKIGLVLLANCDYNEDFRQEILWQIIKVMQTYGE
ncbi:MAG: hypothetical protein OHK0053_14500 [Microscillaceae bacterium]